MPWHRVHVVAAVCFFVSLNASALEFYVAPDGADTNAGTSTQPFQTPEAARDAVRHAKGTDGATVFFAAGRYFRDATFELDERDSGTEAHPVVYKARSGGEVFFDGGRVIAPSDCLPVTNDVVRRRLVPAARDHVRVIDLKALGITDYGKVGPRGFTRGVTPAPLEMFIDDHPLDVARWPNRGEARIPLGSVVDSGSVPRGGDFSMRGGVFRYEVKRAERWKDARDWYVGGVFSKGFADDIIPVAALDIEAGTITTALPHIYGFMPRDFTSWYALNLMEEIDQPGEYKIEPSSGRLYFYPPAGDLTPSSRIYVSLLAEPIVAVEGASHVHIEGITFEHARGTGLYMERGRANQVAGCTFRNLGLLGIQLGQGAPLLPDGRYNGHSYDGAWEPISRVYGTYGNYLYQHSTWDRKAGRDHRILSCDIYDTGAGGILLGGGDRITLTPGNNRVENCDISRVNRWERMYKAPINIDGVGNIVRHCHLHDCPGQAILVQGNDHLFEYNEIDHVLLDMSDQGAVYMGRNPSEAGSVFRHSFFHDIDGAHAGGVPISAFFFDDMSTHAMTIEGNVFYRLGSAGVIRFNGGGESPLINNIWARTRAPVDNHDPVTNNHRRVTEFLCSELGRKRCFEDVNISEPPYLTRYPILHAIYTDEHIVTQPAWRNFRADDHLDVFVDAENLDFRVKNGVRISDLVPGFEPIPFGRIGLYTDVYRPVSTAKP